MVIAGELGEFLDDDAPSRHVHADGQGLGGEHDLCQTLDEALLDDLLERGHHPGMVGGDPSLELGHELLVSEDIEIRTEQAGQTLIRDLPNPRSLVLVGQPEPSGETGPSRFVALGATEDEVDGREKSSIQQDVDRLQPGGRRQLARTTATRSTVVAAATTVPRAAGVETECIVVRSAVHDRRQQADAVVRPVGHEVHVVEANRPLRLHHGRRRPANRADPVGQLVGVADRGRQTHQLDVLGKVDDDLLPDRPTIRILEEVNLVEHDEGKVIEIAPAVDHVAEHFGRHHDDGSVTVDRVVAGQESDSVVTVDVDQIPVLLVRERLDRRGVERPTAAANRRLHAVLGDHGLAAARRRRDDHVGTVVEDVQRVELELVEFERVAGEDVVPVGAHGVSVAGGVSVSRLRCAVAAAGRFARSGSRRSTTRPSEPTGPTARWDRRTA